MSKGETIEYPWSLYQLDDFYKQVRDRHRQNFSDQNCGLLRILFTTVINLATDNNKDYIPNFKAFMDAAKFIENDNW